MPLQIIGQTPATPCVLVYACVCACVCAVGYVRCNGGRVA